MSILVNKMLGDLTGKPAIQPQPKFQNIGKFFRRLFLLVLLAAIIYGIVFFINKNQNTNLKTNSKTNLETTAKIDEKSKQNISQNNAEVIKNISEKINENKTDNLALKIDENLNLDSLNLNLNLPVATIVNSENFSTNLVENNQTPTQIQNIQSQNIQTQNIQKTTANNFEKVEKNTEKNNEKITKNRKTENANNANAHAKIVKTDLIPQKAYDHFQAANEAISQGRTNDAIIALRETLAIAPNYHEARKSLIMQLYNSKQLSAAADVAKRGADLYGTENPDWSIISARLMLENGDVNQAKSTLEKNSNQTMHRVDYQMLMGYTALQQKNYQQANEHYQQAIKTQPRNAAAWFGLAQTLEQQNDINAANQAYQQALNIGNLTPDLQNQAEQKIVENQNKQNKQNKTQSKSHQQNSGEITSITTSPINKSKKVITEIVEPVEENNKQNSENSENAEKSENKENFDNSANSVNSENIQKPAIIENENSTKSHNELTNTQGTILGL